MARRGKAQEEADVWGSATADLERALSKVRRGDRIVSLFQTGPGQGVGDAGAIQLAEALRGCQHQPLNQGLVLFRLRGHQVGDEGAEQLASALESCAGQKLHTFDLGGNRISDEGGLHLRKAISVMSRLRKIDLSANKFMDRAVEEFAQVLPPQLEELQLAGNEIGALGVKALANAVKTHPLKELVLSENKVGNDGADYLAQAFGEGCGLVALHLSWADISDHGASALAHSLHLQTSLRELWLTNNKIEDAGGLHLAAAMERHGQLRLLALDRNGITDNAIREFVSALVRMCKKDLTCSLGHNPSKRFDEDTLRNLSVAAATVRTICKRAMKLEMMLKFWQDCTSVGLIAHQSSTTEDAVEAVILPESSRYGVCYSEFYHCFSPECYVAHSWKGLFGDLLMALAMHASGFTQPKLDPTHEQYARRPEALKRRYFLDIFCIDQARRMPQQNPRCECDKVDFVLAELSRKEAKLLVAMDREHTPMARTWCLAEVFFAKRCQMPILVSFGPIRPMPRRRKGMTWAEAEISSAIDLEFLKEELTSRGPGLGEKFEAEVVKPLQKQALDTYQSVYNIMPVEQQEECDWVKAQDDAREDMKMYAENGNSEMLRISIEAGLSSQVEESTMIPRRRRLAQLELALALNAEAKFTLDDHILELKRTLDAAAEESLDDPELIRRGKKRLEEQEAEARRLSAQKALIALTQRGKRLAEKWEVEQKVRRRNRPEAPWLEVPVIKDRSQMNSQEWWEEEARKKTSKENKAFVKSLRLAGEEGHEAGCDEDVVNHCWSVYAELRVFTAVQAIIRRMAISQAAERARQEAQALLAQAREAKAADREARRQAALESGEDFDEQESETGSQAEAPATEEPKIPEEGLGPVPVDFEEGEDPKDIEDSSVDTLLAALRRGRELRARHEVRDFGKACLNELGFEAYCLHLLWELNYSTEQRSAEELRHILTQVVESGIGSMVQQVRRARKSQEEQRPGVRRFLPKEQADERPAQEQELQSEGSATEDAENATAKAAAAVRKARTRLALLEMADAMEARDLEKLLETVPAAEAAAVEAEEVTAGWRLVHELELAAALKRGDLKEIRQRLDRARAAKVEDDKVLEAARKLALGEIKEGTKLQDAEMLGRALDEGKTAGLTEKQLYMGKNAYLKLQVSSVSQTTDAEAVRKVLAVATDMGLPSDHEDMAVIKARLALLELGEAVNGNDINRLRQCLSAAKEHSLDNEEIEKAVFRMAVLELEQATTDFDSERLRDAMLEAKGLAVPSHLFPPAKRKLADIFPEAYKEWVLNELEEILATLDDDSASGSLREVLREAVEAKVDEEDLKRAEERLAKLELREAALLTDLPEIERILNTAQIYGWDVSKGSAGAMYEAANARRVELQAEERKAECIQNLDLAVLTLDMSLMRQYIQEAQELGVDAAVIANAEAKYQEYA